MGLLDENATFWQALEKVPSEKIHAIKSVLTMVAGHVVHADGPFGLLKGK
jgi:predicted amidohydrolase YtcJ